MEELNSTQDSCELHSATGYRVYLPATQPCTITSTTGYRVPAGTGYTACTLTSTTGYSVYRPATDFTALYSSLNWLQCTGYTALYTGFNNWLQSVPAGTGYTALYTCFNLPVTSLLTGCWLHSPYCTGLHPNWLPKKNKNKWLNIDR